MSSPHPSHGTGWWRTAYVNRGPHTNASATNAVISHAPRGPSGHGALAPARRGARSAIAGAGRPGSHAAAAGARPVMPANAEPRSGDGDRCDKDGRQQVGRDADYAHAALQEHDDRRTGHLSGQRDEQGGQRRARTRQNVRFERLGPRANEEQQPQGREHRQGEPGLRASRGSTTSMATTAAARAGMPLARVAR